MTSILKGKKRFGKMAGGIREWFCVIMMMHAMEGHTMEEERKSLWPASSPMTEAFVRTEESRHSLVDSDASFDEKTRKPSLRVPSHVRKVPAREKKDDSLWFYPVSWDDFFKTSRPRSSTLREEDYEQYQSGIKILNAITVMLHGVNLSVPVGCAIFSKYFKSMATSSFGLSVLFIGASFVTQTVNHSSHPIYQRKDVKMMGTLCKTLYAISALCALDCISYYHHLEGDEKIDHTHAHFHEALYTLNVASTTLALGVSVTAFHFLQGLMTKTTDL